MAAYRAVNVAAVVALVLLATAGGSAISRRFDPSEYFDAKQRRTLDSGRPVAMTSRGPDAELVIVAAARTSITAERFLAWARQIELIQASSLVPAGGRFSDPPQLADLESLKLTDDDLEDLRSCRPGDCGLKLSRGEIVQVRAAAESVPGNWREGALEGFRRVLIARTTSFNEEGPAAMLPYEDDKKPVSAAGELAAVLKAPPAFSRLPSNTASESFLYWSRNTADGARPVLTVTHLTVYPCPSQPLVVSTQVYASHYLDASVSYTALADDGTQRYLLYLRRVRVDLFHGFFGGFIRSSVERRVRSDAPKLLDQVRRRLESGAPPAAAGSGSGR